MRKGEIKWAWEEDGTKVVRSIARTGPGCHQGCGVLLYVKNEKLIKVEGEPEFPHNQGRLCPRCLALTQVVYHPDRLKYPMKRVGKKGEGKWERIPWEEAYGMIAQKFNEIKKKQGPESVIFCQGTGRDIGPYISKLAYSFGSPNKVIFGPLDGHACFAPKVTALPATTGVFFEAGDRLRKKIGGFLWERKKKESLWIALHANWKCPRRYAWPKKGPVLWAVRH